MDGASSRQRVRLPLNDLGFALRQCCVSYPRRRAQAKDASRPAGAAALQTLHTKLPYTTPSMAILTKSNMGPHGANAGIGPLSTTRGPCISDSIVVLQQPGCLFCFGPKESEHWIFKTKVYPAWHEIFCTAKHRFIPGSIFYTARMFVLIPLFGVCSYRHHPRSGQPKGRGEDPRYTASKDTPGTRTYPQWLAR